MYCHNCGKEMGPEAAYCPSCGSRQCEISEPESSIGPSILVRPFFTPLNVLLSVIPLQLFFTLWGAVVFGIAGFFIIQYFEIDADPWTVALVIGAMFFIFTPFIAMYFIMNRYAHSEYRFFSDRLDYQEGFYRAEERSIGYDAIIEVNLVRGFWTRLFNLGTIVLSTAATGGVLGPSRRGIRIPDVQSPRETYGRIKRVLDSYKSS